MKIWVVAAIGVAASTAYADQPDPFHMAEQDYYARFDPDGESLGPGRLDAMWQASPTRTLASLRNRIQAQGDLAVTMIAMSAHQVQDPRLADFLIDVYARSQPIVQRDLLQALTPYDGANDHLEPFLRGVKSPPDSVTRVLEVIDARHRLGYDHTPKLIEDLAPADYVALADQDLLRGLAIHLDGEVPAEGQLRTMVNGTRVLATFERDLEAQVAYKPALTDWVHLDGVLRSVLPGGDEHGKILELSLSYASLTPSDAPRVPTTPSPEEGGCCDGGGGAASPLALLALVTALRASSTSRGGRSRDRSSGSRLPSG